jgi:hypothetical protein
MDDALREEEIEAAVRKREALGRTLQRLDSSATP